MDDAAGRTAASRPHTALERQALEQLEFDWGEAYMIGRDDKRGWWAGRRDSIGALVTAPGPEELRVAIRRDYEARRVPRNPSAGSGG